jgi:replicative DNA helicase
MSELPVDVDAERALCGSVWSGLVILDPESRSALWDLDPSAFFIAEHRAVWVGMRALAEKSTDSPSEHELVWMVGKGKPSPQLKASVLEALSHGSDVLPGPLLDRVRELWRRRIAIQAGRSVIEAAEDLASPFSEVSSAANTAFLEVAKGESAQTKFRRSFDIMSHVETNTPFRTGAAAERLLYFGIDWLDDLLVSGPGNVTVLGGRPGCAKTGLALQARNISAQHGIPSGYFSMEMEEAEVDARDAAWLLSDPSRGMVFSYKQLLREKYDASGALEHLRSQIYGMQNAFSWCDSSGISIGKLVAAMAEATHTYGMKLAIVDKFQDIAPVRQRGDNLASAYAANSQAIKRAAQRLGIHVLLLSQLNTREEHTRPNMGDLKETSQLEQDASAIPMVWKDKDGNLKITLPKHRDGETVTERDLVVEWPCLQIRAPRHETEPQPAFF